MRVPLNGFAPDADPETPGILTDCDAIVPTIQGLSAANSLALTGLPALASNPNNAFIALLLDGTKRFFAATATKIYEAATTSWTDRSRVGSYTGSNRTRFTVFGNNVLSCNRSEKIGQAAPGGNFTDIAAAPAAASICSASGFVLAFDTNDATYGDRPDGWWCSGLRDQTIWAPAASTQAANGRLLDTPGRIHGGVTLGNDVVAYKATSMYLGRYQGPPIIWSWTRVPGDIGTGAIDSVVVVDSIHYFVGPSDFYVFDGTVPRSIGEEVREWFFANLNQSYTSQIIGTVDRPRGLIYWHYPSITSATGALDSVLIYNFRTNRWGKQALAVTAAAQYSAGGVSYDGLGSLYSTYDSLPSVSYDSPFWLADQQIPAVFQGTQLYTLTGAPGAWSFTTGDFGDLTVWSTISRIFPRWRRTPTSATMTNYHRETLGDSRTIDGTVTMSSKRFDVMRAARWHSMTIAGSGAMSLNGLDVEIKGTTAE